MPSAALKKWKTARATQLDEIEAAHAAIGGSGRGRRYATQQVNHAYAMLLSAQFQGFCRDLHAECIDELVNVTRPATMQPVLRRSFAQGRKLDTGNPNPGNLGSDFAGLGIDFWPSVLRRKGRERLNEDRKAKLEALNAWRNAIAHQDFDPAKLSGQRTLTLKQVRGWRAALNGLSVSFDAVVRDHLRQVTGTARW